LTAVLGACGASRVSDVGAPSEQAAGGTGGGGGASPTGGASPIGGAGGTGAFVGEIAGMSGAAENCSLPANYVCTGTHVPVGCGCDPTLVTGEKDCEQTQQLSCDCQMGESEVMECVPEDLTWDYDSVVCHCDASAPLEPTDCAATEDFSCAAYDPFWEDCQCVTGAPKSQADCGMEERFGCEGYNPDYGCYCFLTFR
jgi:hypothetical protein